MEDLINKFLTFGQGISDRSIYNLGEAVSALKKELKDLHNHTSLLRNRYPLLHLAQSSIHTTTNVSTSSLPWFID